MMTITPPRTESSPDISPCATPNNISPDKNVGLSGGQLRGSQANEIPTPENYKSGSTNASIHPPAHQQGSQKSDFQNDFFSNSKLGFETRGKSGSLDMKMISSGFDYLDSSKSAAVGFELGMQSNDVTNVNIGRNSLDSSTFHGQGSLHGMNFGDSHLHSILNGRSLISFNNKGPSPPHDNILSSNGPSVELPNHVPRRNTISIPPVSSSNNQGYRNSTKSSGMDDLKENNLDNGFVDTSFGHGGNVRKIGSQVYHENLYGSSANNWGSAFQGISAPARTSAPPNCQSNNVIGMRSGLFPHRNTMPSMPTSPFAFDNGTFSFSGMGSKSSVGGINMSSTMSNPTFCASSLDCYLVQFTCGRTDTYYIPAEAAPSIPKINIGDYVIVEADRGEDLGRVIMDNINVPMPRRNSTSSAHHINLEGQGLLRLPDIDEMSLPTVSNMPKKIYRLAQSVEIESLLGKIRDELNAIAVGQYKVQEWKLPMAIIDAEYQWDRRKLTFFFSVTLPSYFPNQPSPRIDFRTLVRDLYQIYRTRIWMYCVDKDKNRSNRAHNREKFLNQLNADIEKQCGKQSNNYGNSTGSNRSQNSLKAVLEEHDENWNILEKLNSSESFEKEIDLDELTFAVGDINVNR